MVKESACHCRRYNRCRFDLWVGKSPWRRKWQPTPGFLPGKIPWTEEPGGLQSMELQSQMRLSTCVSCTPKRTLSGHPCVGCENQPGKEFARGHRASKHGEWGFGRLSSELLDMLFNLSVSKSGKMEANKANLEHHWEDWRRDIYSV